MSKLLIILLACAGLLAAVLGYASTIIHARYRTAAQAALAVHKPPHAGILTEEDIQHLPQAVQRYIRFSGAIGKPRVHTLRLSANGRMRFSHKAGWARVQIEQIDLFGKELIRLFYIDMKIMGLHIYGLHRYTRDQARMTGRLLGLIPVLDSHGPEMRVSDTVTLLNDMCLFAPGALTDPRIAWQEVDALTAKAVLHAPHASVSAILTFSEDGRLQNFVSEDRYFAAPGEPTRKLPWTTPVTAYRDADGMRLFARGGAAWQMPEGEYPYIRFDEIINIAFNE